MINKTHITLADIEAEIASEYAFTARQGAQLAIMEAGESHLPRSLDLDDKRRLEAVSIHVLILRNGTKIVGVNTGAIDPARHSELVGKVKAREHAIEQVWPMLGYALRSEIAANAKAEVNQLHERA